MASIAGDKLISLVQNHLDLIFEQRDVEARVALSTQAIELAAVDLTPNELAMVGEFTSRLRQTYEGSLKAGVLLALRARPTEFLTPPEVRDFMLGLNFKFKPDTEAGLQPVGTTLRRLVASGDAEVTGNRPTYRIRGFDAASQEIQDLKAESCV